jgi:hypothetical protein
MSQSCATLRRDSFPLADACIRRNHCGIDLSKGGAE